MIFFIIPGSFRTEVDEGIPGDRQISEASTWPIYDQAFGVWHAGIIQLPIWGDSSNAHLWWFWGISRESCIVWECLGHDDTGHAVTQMVMPQTILFKLVSTSQWYMRSLVESRMLLWFSNINMLNIFTYIYSKTCSLHFSIATFGDSYVRRTNLDWEKKWPAEISTFFPHSFEVVTLFNLQELGMWMYMYEALFIG